MLTGLKRQLNTYTDFWNNSLGFRLVLAPWTSPSNSCASSDLLPRSSRSFDPNSAAPLVCRFGKPKRLDPHSLVLGVYELFLQLGPLWRPHSANVYVHSPSYIQHGIITDQGL